MHGLSPSAAREPGAKLKAFPRISFQISLKGDVDMDYKIVEKGAFKVVGKGLRVSTKDGENLERIPEFWEESCQNGLYDKLCSISNGSEIFGVCLNDFGNEQFTYFIATEKLEGYTTEGLGTGC